MTIGALAGGDEGGLTATERIGAIVTTWRVEPPHAVTPDPAASPAITRRATSAKTRALASAPPDANPLEIQYLVLDLEEGAPTERALAICRRAAPPYRRLRPGFKHGKTLQLVDREVHSQTPHSGV